MELFFREMRLYYKPEENQIIQNSEFQQIAHLPNETFNAFCNHSEAAGKTFMFCGCKKPSKLRNTQYRTK